MYGTYIQRLSDCRIFPINCECACICKRGEFHSTYAMKEVAIDMVAELAKRTKDTARFIIIDEKTNEKVYMMRGERHK